MELKKNRDDLLFEKGYNLNIKLLEIDLLVIKKQADVRVCGICTGSWFGSKQANSVNCQNPVTVMGPAFYRILAIS